MQFLSLIRTSAYTEYFQTECISNNVSIAIGLKFFFLLLLLLNNQSPGVACEKNPEAFAPYTASALQALGACVALGDVADDSNDEQPSTASASVGGATNATGASGGGESGGSNDSSKGNSGSGGGKRVARGECTDNAVAAVGTVLEQMQLLGVDLQLNQQFMWEQWLNYLPLRADVVSLVQYSPVQCILAKSSSMTQ